MSKAVSIQILQVDTSPSSNGSTDFLIDKIGDIWDATNDSRVDSSLRGSVNAGFYYYAIATNRRKIYYTSETLTQLLLNINAGSGTWINTNTPWDELDTPWDELN